MKLLTKEDLQKLPHNFQVLFAVFCAKQVIHLVRKEDKKVCLKAIEIAEAFIEGKATKEQAYAAAYAANTAAYTVVYAAANAAYAAANAEYAAVYAAVYAAANAEYAANADDRQKLVKEQRDYYNELLNFDKNFEEIVLMGIV